MSTSPINCPCGRPAATASENAKAHAEKKCSACYVINQYVSLFAKKAPVATSAESDCEAVKELVTA